MKSIKVLFVENKYKTILYSRIADQLKKKNYDVSFLVQNKLFAPKHNCFLLSTGKGSDVLTGSLLKTFEDNYERVRTSDRNINYFNGNSNHYKNYFDQIEKVLGEFEPDIVFGESTLFHELMTIVLCEAKGIRYLHPSSCRIPNGRFSFYIGDSLVPFSGSGEKYETQMINDITDSFGNRAALPDYMSNHSKYKKTFRKLAQFKNSCMSLVTSTFIERFNTPTVITKIGLQKQLEKDLIEWDEVSINKITNVKKRVLYPMHMQPECNIDVWGRENREQLEVIRKLSSVIPEDWELLVKLNPKSKYEVTNSLVSFCRESDNTFAVDRGLSMGDIVGNVDLIITVSGTVAYECFFTSKPCLSMSIPFFEENWKSRHLDSIDWIDIVGKFNTQLSENTEPECLVNYLTASSYNGIVADPISSTECMSKENIEKISIAILDLVKLENRSVKNKVK